MYKNTIENEMYIYLDFAWIFETENVDFCDFACTGLGWGLDMAACGGVFPLFLGGLRRICASA